MYSPQGHQINDSQAVFNGLDLLSFLELGLAAIFCIFGRKFFILSGQKSVPSGRRHPPRSFFLFSRGFPNVFTLSESKLHFVRSETLKTCTLSSQGTWAISSSLFGRRVSTFHFVQWSNSENVPLSLSSFMSQPASTAEIPYEKADLKGKKASLLRFVARQSDKWPGPDVYDAKSTSVKRLRNVLLDSRYGFTKPATSSVVHESVTPPSTPPFQRVQPEPEKNKEKDLSNLLDSESDRELPQIQESHLFYPTDSIEQCLPSRWIKLFIEDTRGTSTAKISQELCLFVVDTVDCTPGEWRAELRDLLVELQQSNAAITGPVRLSCRDPEQPEYWVPFVKVTDDALLDEAETFPEFVSIPSSNRLEIRVEHAEDAYFHSPPRRPSTSTTLETFDTFDLTDPTAIPLEHARRRAANRPAGRNTNDDQDRDTKWLIEQLKSFSGYEDFKSNQRKVQANPGVVRSWNFIANFSARYYKQVSHVQGRRKIQKQSIYKALGLGSTAIAEAENAARILNIYGDNGTSPAQAVIDRVNLIEDPPKGARA
ncbi:hypothetical protein FB451DRAFT_1313225, partial [Mycena latifolia]